MKKQCEICGEEKKLEKHHIDYAKNIILNICGSCHHSLHQIKNKVVPLGEKRLFTCGNCSYSWNYRGHNPYYTCCPKCHYNVNIQKQLKN